MWFSWRKRVRRRVSKRWEKLRTKYTFAHAMCTSCRVIYLWHQVLCMCFRSTVLFTYTSCNKKTKKCLLLANIESQRKVGAERDRKWQKKRYGRKMRKKITIVEMCKCVCVCVLLYLVAMLLYEKT